MDGRTKPFCFGSLGSSQGLTSNQVVGQSVKALPGGITNPSISRGSQKNSKRDLIVSVKRLGNGCSLGLRYVFLVPNCQFSFSHLGFWSVNFFLMAPFPDHFV